MLAWSVQQISSLLVDNSKIEEFKEDSVTSINSLLFQTSLYPSTEYINILADRVFNNAIMMHQDNGTHSSSLLHSMTHE
jgi:hypothetical protein